MFSDLFVRSLRIDGPLPRGSYLNSLPIIKSLQKMERLDFSKQVTFLVGENGTGKSTLIEALAVNLGFNPEGGTLNFNFSTEDSHSDLYKYLRVTKGIGSRKDGFFRRAESFYNGASNIDKLCDGDTVLISEGCTHHRQCNDIGTVKLPKLIKKYTKKAINFEFTSGGDFPKDLLKYKMVVHCGGCMLNENEMQYRYKTAKENNIPITNYGMAIAYMNGIIKRSVSVFSELKEM